MRMSRKAMSGSSSRCSAERLLAVLGLGDDLELRATPA